MKKYLRTLFVTFLICVAAAIIAAAILFRAAHLSFYNSSQAQAKYDISQQDLALVKSGNTTYVWTIPKAGSAINALHDPLDLVILVYLPALLISLYEIRRLATKR